MKPQTDNRALVGARRPRSFDAAAAERWASGFTTISRRSETALDRIAWFAFFGLTPLLWANGVWLFAHSGLTARKKALWTLFLVALGVAVGLLLPLAAIRNRLLLLLALLPVLAFIDLRLARSNRTLLFWVRACSFEVCTVCACAALTRLALTLR